MIPLENFVIPTEANPKTLSFRPKRSAASEVQGPAFCWHLHRSFRFSMPRISGRRH